MRLRAPLLASLDAELKPDVLCLQETKSPDELFPHAAAKALGYSYSLVRGMKGYNGVAVLSRFPLHLRSDEPNWCDRSDCRHIGVNVESPNGSIELHNFYVPAGGDIPDRSLNAKFAHKLDFMAEVTRWSAARPPHRRAVLVGDLNVAPLEHDVWSHRQMLAVVSHTPMEVDALNTWQRTGNWYDALRHFVPTTEKLYTWWSYRARDWEAANRGRRLDHIWVSEDLAGLLRGCVVLKSARRWERSSDHVPVMIKLEL